MKVLFAVNSEKISDLIIKKYQKDYKEILAYKNVYYFNAILKEIQRDKSYDRIIISEDLEPFANNNYDTIDKFVFEKLDSISDEAHDMNANEIPLILICTERRVKGSNFLVKLFSLGIYNALLGTDRSMEQVCKLINRPRGKKEAKLYYKIDTDDVSYRAENENEVSELEIQNILTHFKKLGRNTQRYNESFNNIASQYTDEQLKIIINCLPIKVRAVLEEQSPKYQEIMTANGFRRVGVETRPEDKLKNAGLSINMIGNQNNKMSGPIVIPNAVRTTKINKPVNITQPQQPQGVQFRQVTPQVQQPQVRPQFSQNNQPVQQVNNVNQNVQQAHQQPMQNTANSVQNTTQQAGQQNNPQYTPEQIKVIARRYAEARVNQANLTGKYTPEQIKIITDRQALAIEQQLLARQNGTHQNIQAGQGQNESNQ